MGNTLLDSTLRRVKGGDKKGSVEPKRGKRTGLGQLHQKAVETTSQDGEILFLDTDLIDFEGHINQREQDWLHDGNPQFTGLLESIRSSGQKVPILVRRTDNGRYSIIYGSRRTKCAQILGHKVKALVTDKLGVDKEAHLEALVENIYNEALSPLEDARNVVKYMHYNPEVSDVDVGELYGRTRRWVQYQLSFAGLPDLFVGQCSDPWSITERGTRKFRTVWGKNDRLKRRWQDVLETMEQGGEKLPFKALIKLLDSPKKKVKPKLVRNSAGAVVAEIAPPSTVKRRKAQSVCFYEGVDEETVKTIIEKIAQGLD